MDKIVFEDGTKISDGKVTIDGQDYVVVPAQYSGRTPLSAYVLNKLQENIENAINDAKQRNIITARLNQDITCTTAETKQIPLTKLYQTGGNLSVTEDGGILIGENVNYITVSAILYYYYVTVVAPRRIYIDKKRNGSTYSELSTTVYIGNSDGTVFLPATMIPVEEGDIIYLSTYMRKTETISAYNTYLTIETVG